MQMRAGLVASTAVHVVLLTWGLWSLSAPKALEAQYAEALPVEVIMSETFEGVKGEKTAPLTEKPAPKPTTKPQTLPMEAKNAGDNEADLETPPVPDAKPTKVEAKPQPKAADLPQEVKPEPKPEPPVKVAEKAPTPPPPTPPKEEPKKEAPPPKEDPLAEAIKTAEAEPKPEDKPTPKPVPKPVVKPQPPKPDVAKAETKPEPKKTDSKAKEKPKKEVAEKASEEGSEFDADAIMAQLNKAKPAGGGAKRSTETASLGSKVTTGTKLSRSQLGQLDGLIKDKMRECWNPPAGIESGESLRVSIRIRFDPAGEVEGVPEVTAGGGSGAQRIAAEAAIRAIRRCAPFNLPSEMYAGGWEVTNLNFDPSEMF